MNSSHKDTIFFVKSILNLPIISLSLVSNETNLKSLKYVLKLPIELLYILLLTTPINFCVSILLAVEPFRLFSKIRMLSLVVALVIKLNSNLNCSVVCPPAASEISAVSVYLERFSPDKLKVRVTLAFVFPASMSFPSLFVVARFVRYKITILNYKISWE